MVLLLRLLRGLAWMGWGFGLDGLVGGLDSSSSGFPGSRACLFFFTIYGDDDAHQHTTPAVLVLSSRGKKKIPVKLTFTFASTSYKYTRLAFAAFVMWSSFQTRIRVPPRARLRTQHERCPNSWQQQQRDTWGLAQNERMHGVVRRTRQHQPAEVCHGRLQGNHVARNIHENKKRCARRAQTAA